MTVIFEPEHSIANHAASPSFSAEACDSLPDAFPPSGERDVPKPRMPCRSVISSRALRPSSMPMIVKNQPKSLMSRRGIRC